MQIEAFNELFKAQNPQGYAYIPEKMGKRQNAVNVVYQQNGKVYTYKDSIYSIAEKLGLIPEVNMFQLAAIINRRLAAGEKEVLAPYGASDTCVHTWNGATNGTSVKEIESDQKDKYGRKLAIYTIYKYKDDPWYTGE